MAAWSGCDPDVAPALTRRGRKMSKRIHLGVLVLAGASVACSVFVGGPPMPDPAISASPDALQTLQSDLAQAMLEGLLNGTVALTFTEEQVTAYLASWLSAQKNPILTDPQVDFGEQEIIVYGQAHPWIFVANAAAAVRFEVDNSGLPRVAISSVQVGPVPLPKVFRDSIAAAADEALTGYLGPVATGFRLESIDISGGLMTVSGRLR